MTGEELGRGGWSEVKVGVFRGKRVAVKRLHQEIISPHYLQLFSREMEVASRVRHPNLLQFIGATKVGQLMIITELMPTSLRRELEKHSLLRSQVISIATDVVSALNYLHSFSLVLYCTEMLALQTFSLNHLRVTTGKASFQITDRLIYWITSKLATPVVPCIQLPKPALPAYTLQLWIYIALVSCC